MLEFMRLNESPGTIVFKHDPVTPHHVGPVTVLRQIEVIPDQLKNNIVTRECENEHDHSAHPLGRNETVARLPKMTDEVAIKFGFGVPIIANGVVEIGESLAWHELSQPSHQKEWTRCIDSKIRAGVRKKDREICFANEDSIEGDATLIGMPETECDGHGQIVRSIAMRAANDIGAMSAIKYRPDDFDRRSSRAGEDPAQPCRCQFHRNAKTVPATFAKPAQSFVSQETKQQLGKIIAAIVAK